MVQVTFDTNNDSLAELEEALKILESALMRRKDAASPVAKSAPKMDIAEAVAEEPAGEPVEPVAQEDGAPEPDAPEPAEEETAIDTPFLKITVKSDDHRHKEEPEHAESKGQKPERKGPTLNQLLHDASLTEDELSKMFKEQMAEDGTKRPKDAKPKKDERKDEQKDEGSEPFIEIVEYSDEK